MRLFIDALWSTAGKGLTSWPSFVMYNCEVVTFPLLHGSGVVLDCMDCQVWCLIVWILDLCLLLTFIVVWLFLAMPWVCLQFVNELFPDHTHLLFFCLETGFGQCHLMALLSYRYM